MKHALLLGLVLLSACSLRRAPLPVGKAYDTAALVVGLRPDLFPMDTISISCWTGQNPHEIECIYLVESDNSMEYKRLRVRR